MGKVSAECADLAAAINRLQDGIGELMSAAGSMPNADAIRDLQDADRITQTLNSMSRLAAALAVLTSGTDLPRAELSQAIALESVAQRLLS